MHVLMLPHLLNTALSQPQKCLGPPPPLVHTEPQRSAADKSLMFPELETQPQNTHNHETHTTRSVHRDGRYTVHQTQIKKSTCLTCPLGSATVYILGL